MWYSGDDNETVMLMLATPRTPSTDSDRARSAVFTRPGETYRADCCEAVRTAVRRGELRHAALVRRGYPGRRMPARMLPEVSNVGFWDATTEQTWGLKWHRNEGIELTYLSRGRLEFSVDSERFLLKSGDLTVTRPWQHHCLGNPHIGPSRLHWLILDVAVRHPNQPWKWPSWLILSPADVRQLTTLLSHNEQPVWRANREIAACFERLAVLAQTTKPLTVQTRLQLHINELFVALLELLQKREVKLDARLVSRRRTVELFLAALPQHLEKEWTLDEMAYQCSLGASAFTAYCQQITNLTPAKYLTLCRVEAAKRMLAEQPEMTITEVALACGFQSSQYLATVFHNSTGLSPRDFRQQLPRRALIRNPA